MSKAAAVKKEAGNKFPTGNLTPHKLSSIVPGEMSSDEYKALCTSIKEDGLQNAIVVYEGQILDGRHRYQACKELGIKPTFTEFKGDTKQATALVLDNNLHRRTLNSMQKALVAARMHIEAPAATPVSQKDSAARVGVGVATVNLAVRLINSKNTPLIKRCEQGEATRAEIDELLYDRAAQQAEPVAPAVDGDDDALGAGAAPANVIDLDSKRPSTATAGKQSHPERHARETAASRVVQAFKGLDTKGRIDFVKLGWSWLAPALKAAGHTTSEAPAGAVVAKPPVKPIGAQKPSVAKKGMRKAIKADAKAQAAAAKAAAKLAAKAA